MRRLLSALTVATGTAAFLAVPVVARPASQPHPVRPHVVALAVPAAAPAAAPAAVSGHRPAPRARPHVVAHLARPETHRFDLVGATWRAGTWDPGAATVEVRVHQGDGWSEWTALAPQDGGADGGSADARRAARVRGTTQAAEPTYVGSADGVEARVVGAGAGREPGDLHVVLVDGGTSPADADPAPAATLGGSVAEAAAGRPTIYTRADWGADESLRRHACPSGPDYGSTIKMGFIHHTDGGNGYSRRQVPSIIRSIYAYHVKGNGWCDVGYNFLVDRFGRIWEGRYGGINRPVIGAHTGGFNTDTFGVSLIGTFTTTKPSAEMKAGLERLFAWRFARYYLDPNGRSTTVAGSFSGSRYRTGRTVTFKSVSGHRDADYTTCPGDDAYGEFPDIRAGVVADMGAGFVRPALSSDAVRMGSGPVTVDADVVADQAWQLAVTDAAGVAVRTYTGVARPGTPVNASWDLTGSSGTPVPPGDYTLTLTGGSADGATARPWSSTVTVTPPISLHAHRQVGLGDQVVAHGRGTPGHSVQVSVDAADGTQQPVTVATVDDAGKWTTSPTTVTADRDLTWTAADPAAAGYQRTRTTRVRPVITAPADATSFVDSGTEVTVTGTALPAAGPAVTLMTRGVDGGAAARSGDAQVQPDGTWSVSFTPTVPTSFWVVDGRRLHSAPHVVYPLAAPTAEAPDSGYAGRRVTVSGDAGGPVSVTLSSRPSGGTWTRTRTVTAKADGTFAADLPLPDSADAMTWKVDSGHGTPATGSVTVQPVFAPTVDGPRRVAWNHARPLTGTAVPGDRVKVLVAPVGSSDWRVAGRTHAADDSSWQLPVRFTADTQWRVRSPSGRSATGTTFIKPSIHAHHTVRPREAVRVHGRAIPGKRVRFYRQRPGSGNWVRKTVVRASSDGRWSVTVHPRHTVSFRVRSHHQASHPVTVTVA